MFYSEENQCSWESKHSFGYVVMFIILTLGLILVLKWVMKTLEIVIFLLKVFKHRISPSAPLESSVGDEENSIRHRIWATIRPEIYMVDELIEENR